MNQSRRPKNPFLESAIADSKDIWADDLVMFDELHNSAFHTIIDALREVKGVFSIALTGSTGTGKTHLVARIRHHLRDQAYCIYVNADKVIHLDNFSAAFLKFVIDNLSRPSSSGVMYIQEIATALFNRALEVANKNKRFQPQELTNEFNSLVRKDNNLVDKVRSIIQKDNPALTDSTNLIRAILWTLSTSGDNFLAPIALDWLKGEEISSDDARIMKLPSGNEQGYLDRSLQILRIASLYKPIIICFDELESNKADKYGRTTKEVVADFIYTLHNNLESTELTHPILILSLWIPQDWDQVLQANKSGGVGGVNKRFCSYTRLESQPISLDRELLNEESGLRLVRLWLEKYEALGSTEPFEYVGGETALRAFTKQRPTPRRLWEWCCQAWEKHFANELSVPLYDQFQERLETRFMALKDSSYPELMDDDHLISQILIFAFNHVIGETIENVQVQAITPTKNVDHDRFQFTIKGIENGKNVAIGVGVCQTSNVKMVNTMVRRLCEYKKYQLTRGCFVRSENRRITQTSQAYQNLQKLISPPLNGEFVKLHESEIKELHALKLLAEEDCEQPYPADILADFIRQKSAHNPLIKEILSDPSGQIPDRVVTQTTIEVASTDDEGDLSLDDLVLETEEKQMLQKSPSEIVHDLLIEQFHQPLTVVFITSDGENISGAFVEDATNRIFDYQINSKGLSYRMAKFLQDMPTKKVKVLNRFNKQELIALLRIYIELYRVYGGTIEILTNDDFTDPESALEQYGFYPASTTSTPIIYYKDTKFQIGLGVYLFWDDEENESLSSAFVDDNPAGEFVTFDDFDQAFNHFCKRILYYLQEG